MGDIGHVLLRVLLLAALCVLSAAALPRAAGAPLLLLTGLGLGALLRWGPSVLPGLVIGAFVVALLQPASQPLWAVASAVAITLGAVSGWATIALRRQAVFDRRLLGVGDVGAVIAAACIAAVAPTALWVAFSESIPLAMQAVPVVWLVLAVATLLAAVPMCSTNPPPPGWAAGPGGRTRAIGLVAMAVACLAAAGVVVPPGIGGSLWASAVGGPVLLLGLATLLLAGGIALAMTVLAGAALAAAWATAAALPPGPFSLMSIVGWAGGAGLMLLGLHAWAQRARHQEAALHHAIEGAGHGWATWKLSGASHAVALAEAASPTWRALSGDAPGPAATLDAWLQDAHPEDVPRLQAALHDLLREGSTTLRQQIRRRQEGDWRWRELGIRVAVRDVEGRPMRIVTSLSNSEAQHDAQDRQRLAASLFHHLHEGLVITDAELRVLDANPAYAAILGVPLEEQIGQVPPMLRPTRDPLARQQRAAMSLALRNQGTWRGELSERRRDGELRTLQLTISTVLDPDGILRYHVLAMADITEQRSQRERLERQAHFDELTRLPNRARLSQLLADAMRATDRDGFLLVVCYLDLDRFKPVNDRFGHSAGDSLLVELAVRLRGALRSRGNWHDAAARLGGDEFVLLLRAGTLDEARLAAERVLRVVSQPYTLEGSADPVVVTASMGATIYPIDRSDADTLLRHADHAMYDAKQSGRNGYLFFDPEHRRRTEERVMAIGRVQEALDRREFVLHYQPKVDMREARVLGLEALLRWEHPQQGLVAPAQFLPLIENTGLSAHVGDWVLSQALEHLAQWRAMGLDLSVSVNISARHLQEPDFAQRLSELLARYPDPLATHLELEMLETAAHADIESTSALLTRCRALGVRFALDDFGTGYSTLTYLKRLPVDVLKIDRSFVHHMLDDAQDRALVEGVIGLARTFGCTVVAEGVESPAQARTLLDMGCAIGQGTGIAAPMPASQVADWVRGYRGVFKLAPAEVAPPARVAGGDASQG